MKNSSVVSIIIISKLQFEYGTIEGVYPSIDTPGGGCSNFCIKGYGTAEARGCNQFPPQTQLVGFEYDCEQATCKCLYQAGTLGSLSKCFDDMNTSNQGNVYSGGSAEEAYSLPSQGQTCYVRVFDGLPLPSPRTGTGICSYDRIITNNLYISWVFYGIQPSLYLG